jgi:riboflavin kinase/FMN adenylyltransferase
MAVYLVNWHEPFPYNCRDGALTIGNFDGVHRGHQALLGELHRQAALVRGPAVAMTFDPPPSRLLRPQFVPAALTTLADRTALMQAHGAEHVLVLQTTPEFLQTTAQEFFDSVVQRELTVKTLVPGFNFAFGHNREGNVNTLATMCHQAGIGCIAVPPLVIAGLPVSSSRIRASLKDGKVEQAAALLGRNHRVSGTVIIGQQRGKSLGFPTANLGQVATMIPADGVYAVLASVGERIWPAAANIGPNPTFGEQTRKLEVHLLDFAGDLYGQTLRVEFLRRIRDTMKFPDVAALVSQMHADIAMARRIVEDALEVPQ